MTVARLGSTVGCRGCAGYWMRRVRASRGTEARGRRCVQDVQVAVGPPQARAQGVMVVPQQSSRARASRGRYTRRASPRVA